MARASTPKPAPKKTAPPKAKAVVSKTPDVSVVVPVYNEEGAAPELAREIAAAFKGRNFEIVFVDDASKDETVKALCALRPSLPQLRVVSHRTNAGQSRAVRTGVINARGPIIVTLDGDGQNDPADAPRMVDNLAKGPATLGLIGGTRIKRQDTLSKRYASKIANAVRQSMLKDGCPDAGCGLKVFRRDAFLALPYFDHLHRYLPTMMLREGYEVAFETVNHRHRTSGVSKYNNLGRLLVSFADLQGVMWLQRRGRNPGGFDEIQS